jgi:hypothetical protein
MTDQQKIIDDGTRARRLLEDGDLLEFLQEVEDSCVMQRKKSNPEDQANREMAYAKLLGVQMVESFLKAKVDAATIALKRK